MRRLGAILIGVLLLVAAAAPAQASRDWNRLRPQLMDMARGGYAADAYRYALQVVGEDAWDARFVAGYIAFRRLQRPDLAVTHFAEIAVSAGDAYGKAKAGFWLGRALAAVGRETDAAKAWTAAAAWSHTFYGQVSAARLGGRPAIATDPRTLFGSMDVTEVLATPQGRRIAEAQAAGDVRGRNDALRRLAGGSFKDMGIACAMAVHTGAVDIAVDIARSAARRGIALVECGWPRIDYAWHDHRVPTELVLAVSREESTFNQNAVSGAGANGSMQVTDGAARDVAKRANVAVDLRRVRTDANYNVAVGSYYLGDLMNRYSGHPVLALAAYNAGPGRADEWLGKLGDPRTGQIDIVDWIEEIPFQETRAYVQRVFSSSLVYASQSKRASK